MLSHLKKWVRNWDPRSKTIASMVFIIGVISLQSPFILLFTFILVLLVSRIMGIRFLYMMTRLALLAPLLVFMAVPLVFGGGLPVTEDRINFASLIVLKALTSMLVMIIMVTTQSLQEYLDGLANMKVPPLLITVLFLAFRYAFLFIEELKCMQRALKSRLFNAGADKRALLAYGEISGAMLIKAIDRSENVYRAMSSRCFDGNLPVSKPPMITRSDIIKSLSTISLIVLLVIIERWYLI